MANIVEISSLDRPELAAYARLTEAELRSRQSPEKAVFIAESDKVIDSALRAGCEPISLLMERKHISGKAAGLISLCGDVPVYTGDSELLEQLTGFRLSRGILCAMRRPREIEMGEILPSARRVAVLEGIRDPANVGSVFRSAAALGMDAVLLSPDCCDPLYRRAARVSMGTVFRIPWARLGTTQTGIEQLHSSGFKCAALALSEHSLDIDDPAPAKEERLALFLGTEGEGLTPQTLSACDYTLRIPMSRGVDSLNVSTAAAIAFWQLGRKQ